MEGFSWNGFSMVRTSESFPSTGSDGGKASLGETKFCQQASQEWLAVAKTEQEPKADFGGAVSCPQGGAGSPSHPACSEELTAGTRCPRKRRTLVPEPPRLHSCVVTSSHSKVGQERPGDSSDVVPAQLGGNDGSASSCLLAGLSLTWVFPVDLEKLGGETKAERMKAKLSSSAKWFIFPFLKVFQILIKDQLSG